MVILAAVDSISKAGSLGKRAAPLRHYSLGTKPCVFNETRIGRTVDPATTFVDPNLPWNGDFYRSGITRLFCHTLPTEVFPGGAAWASKVYLITPLRPHTDRARGVRYPIVGRVADRQGV